MLRVKKKPVTMSSAMLSVVVLNGVVISIVLIVTAQAANVMISQ